MNFLKYYCEKNLKHNLVNKFLYFDTKKIPKIKKIILNFGCKTNDIKSLSAGLLALELMTNQKSKLTRSKLPILTLKIRQGNPIGCKITLRKNIMFNYISKMSIEVFPKLKNFEGLYSRIKQNAFSYSLTDIFTFSILEEHYYLFNNLPKLNITIVTSTKTKQELFFILNYIQLPFKVNKQI
jgi:large subunit ribosomal protein L5